MKDVVVLLNNTIRESFRKYTCLLAVLLAISIFLELFMICLAVYIYLDLGDSIFHFYMNTKTSMEYVNNVKFDQYDGSIQRDLTTEELLIRKQAHRWHLRYLFK